MVDLIAQGIPNLTDVQLISLAKDAEYRIGSHISGGFQCDQYVEHQRKILSLIQDELINRRN